MENNENLPEEKKPALDPAQERELRELMPDFEPQEEKQGTGKAAAADDKQSIMMVSLMYAGIFGVLASRLGAHWNLSEAEVASLAAPTVAVMAKYFPSMRVGPEMALLSAVAMVVVPRLMVPGAVEGEVVEGEGDGDKSEHAA